MPPPRRASPAARSPGLALSLLVVIVVLAAPAPADTIRLNFNFPGRRPTPPPPEPSDAPVAAAPGAPEASARPAPGAPDAAASLQQVRIPIQIPATANVPAYAVDLVVMAPPGVQVRQGAPPQHMPDVAATIQHHHQHAQQVQRARSVAAAGGHQHNRPPAQAVHPGLHHHHQHHSHSHSHNHEHVSEQHRRAPHVCPHHQPTPGQLAVQTMLQIASQQCNQMQYHNPSAPFHWPDRVLICPHEPDEAGNNMQVLMLHRHQRAVFEINTNMDDVRAVIPPMLLHVHDVLYTGLVRKAADGVVEALPQCVWPSRPQDKEGDARRAGDALDGKWTVEWLNGSTILHGASLMVSNGTFRVMDTDYYLRINATLRSPNAAATHVSFEWPDGSTVQTLASDEGSLLTWTTSDESLPGIVWRRGWAGNLERREDEGTEAKDETHECAICCEQLADLCIWLPCGHPFHDRCIKKWLSEASTCPTCRHSLPSQHHEVLPDASSIPASQPIAPQPAHPEGVESHQQAPESRDSPEITDAIGAARAQGSSAAAHMGARDGNSDAVSIDQQGAGEGASGHVHQFYEVQRVEGEEKWECNHNTELCNTTSASAPACRYHGAHYVCSVPGCSLVLCAGCWRLVKDTCVYHWETQLLLRPPAFAIASPAEGAPLDERANAPAPGSPAAEENVPAIGTQAQADTTMHTDVSTTHSFDTHTSITHSADAHGADTHSTDIHASTTHVCTDSQISNSHVPTPGDTDAHAGIPAASEPDNTSLVQTHTRTHTHTHATCESHTNAPANSVGQALEMPSPALSASGVVAGEAESKRRGGYEGESDGQKEGGTENVCMKDEEEKVRQNRLMRSVAQFLKEASGGAGCEGAAGCAGIGGVGNAAAHLRQSPPRLLLRNSAEQEAVSIAAMVLQRHFGGDAVNVSLAPMPGVQTVEEKAQMTQLSLQDMETLSRLAMQAGKEHKETGNLAFREGRFREAMLCYQRALSVCPVGPTAVTYLGNLAATQSKLQQWDGVLQTCARALEMNPCYTKALMLRARAQMNSWCVSDAVDTYRRALKVQEDALAGARARAEAVLGASMPKQDGTGTEAQHDVDGNVGMQREAEKHKLIAAVMRDTSLSPQERQLKIHGIRTGKAGVGLEDGADGGRAAESEKSPEDVAVEAEEREVENARQQLQRALKMATLLGHEADLGDGFKGERAREVNGKAPGGWTATFSSPMIRLSGFERLGQRQNVVYNAQYQASHVFFLGGESRLSLNFSLTFIPPQGLSLQVRHLVASNSESARPAGDEHAPAHEDKALLDVKLNGCFIKHHYQPPSKGDYLSEVWNVPVRALRRGPNELVWDYLRGSTTHYWLQTIRLFSDPGAEAQGAPP